MDRLTLFRPVSLLLACAAAAVAQTAASPAPVPDGHTLFNDKGCAHCHGPEAAGGPDAPDLRGLGKRLSPDAIRRQIVEGGKSMPAFGDALTPEETDGLIAWVRSLKAAPKPHIQRGS